MQHRSICYVYGPAQAERIAHANSTFLLMEEPPNKWVRLATDWVQVCVATSLNACCSYRFQGDRQMNFSGASSIGTLALATEVRL